MSYLVHRCKFGGGCNRFFNELVIPLCCNKHAIFRSEGSFCNWKLPENT